MNVDTAPDYILEFIDINMNKLKGIYNENYTNELSCLGFNCSKNENKMDVFFLNNENMKNNLDKEVYNNIKNNYDNDNSKILFLINDFDIKSIFLIYV